jgi:aspartate dehydrogenase
VVRVGLIGAGAIGAAVLERLPERHEAVAVLVRSQRHPAGVATLDELLAARPDVVVECAGQATVAEYVEPLLAAGIDVMVVSTGALADDGLRERLAGAAGRGGGALLVPAGAIGALDALGALRAGGVERVTYTSIKPPHAWRGTPAEQVADLAALRGPVELFRGDPREAGRRFPKNANVAVAVALAAGSFERTTVVLVADPAVEENVGLVEAEGSLGSVRVEVRGPAAPGNPRTSAITAMSIVNALEQRSGAVRIAG